MVSSRPPAALSLLPAPPSRLPLLLLTAVSLLPLACQTAESSPPGSGSVRPGSDSGSVLSDVSNFTELLTARYAPNGTWSESGVSELAAAVQRAITCHGAHCTGGADPACVPADRLLAQLGPGEVSIQSLCPALLHQSQEPGCLTRLAEQAAPRGRTRPAPAEVWGYGMLFVTIISLSSIFAVLLLPLLGRKNFERLMPGMIGLAVGSLSSSALFHLIPQAFDLVVDGAGHGYLNTSLCVLAGAWFFFMIERLMKITLDYKKRHSASPANGPRLESVLESPSTAAPSNSPSSSSIAEQTGCAGVVMPNSREVKEAHAEPVRAMFGQVEQKPHSHHHHHHELTLRRGSGVASEIAIVAWMIIFGDGFHNFLDGLSIGAAFSENILTGISISLAVLCEELPHELGDFAVLLDAGMTVRQAVVYNFLSACTCYLGLVLGILIGDFTESTSFVFALAGGMFLYISLVDMVPEMNEAAEKASSVSVCRGLRVLLVQNIGIMLGVFSLFSLAYFSDSLTID